VNKSIILGSLVLAGVVMVGCGKKDDPNAKPIDKTTAIQGAGEKVNPVVPTTGPTTMGTMMENGKEKASSMIDTGKEKAAEGMKSVGAGMEKMGEKVSTTQP
jgi:hypothetical protein